jgi:hypothetical protein
VPAAPLSPEGLQSINIPDYKSDDSDESDSDTPEKAKPQAAWAAKHVLGPLLARQASVDPDEIFR